MNPVGISKGMLRYFLGEANYVALRTYYRFQLDRLRGKSPLFVHTMGKVGSSSIVRSLRKLELEREVTIYWTHFLSPEGISLLNQLHEKGYGGSEEVPQKEKNILASSRVIGQQLMKKEPKDKKVKVITLVRDPVATNISGFFQNYAWWPPELQRRLQEGSTANLDDLSACFFSNYPHDVPLTWFDIEMTPIFGIDVFSSPFPSEKGYQIYQSERSEALLLKLEKLDEIAVDALQSFLSINNFRLVKENVGHEKWYSDIYDQFKATVRLPDSYLNKMYRSPFAQHFYREEEINAFMTRWNSVLPVHARRPTLTQRQSINYMDESTKISK